MKCLQLLPLLACLTACSLSTETEKEAIRSETTSRLVGRVASVPEGGAFVLIEAYGPWRVPEGGLLSGIGTEGRTSNLVVSGEKLGRFAAADIRSGVAKVGDAVYFRPVKEEGASEEIPETMMEGGAEPVEEVPAVVPEEAAEIENPVKLPASRRPGAR